MADARTFYCTFALPLILQALGTWYGGVLVVQSRNNNPNCIQSPSDSGCFSGGDVVTVFVSALLGALTFGQLGPLFGTISAARAAGADIFGVIDAQPTVDANKEGGFRPSKGFVLDIEFKNVTFAFPTRPDVPIFRNFNLKIPAGTNLGICGASGSGKSTILALVLRQYDVQAGEVLVGGKNVKEYDLASLRACFALVSQEPVLFPCSIRENIAMGKSGLIDPTTGKPEAATMEEIITAAKAANAHGFITALKDGFDTVAGTSVSSANLSGGQRQRICIARALLRPSWTGLVLDEATASLDRLSEATVQQAIDKITSGDGSGGASHRLTLSIAHRLSTLQNCNRIIVMAKGEIIEDGTPKELASIENGVYASMMKAQEVKGTNAVATASQLSMSTADVGAGVGTAAAPPADAAPAEKEPSFASKLPLEPSPTSTIASPESAAAKVAEPATAAAVVAVEPPKEVKKEEPQAPPAATTSTTPQKATLKSRLWKLQMEDWPVLFPGIVGALMSGCVQPLTSIVYGGVINIYFQPSSVIESDGASYVGWFFLLAFACLVGVFCRVSVFTFMGERLTRKLRIATFQALVRQPAAFFDNTANATGKLATRLATDAALVKGATGDSLGSIVEAFGAISAAIAIAFSYSWRLALVLCAVFPLLVVGQAFEFGKVSSRSRGESKLLEESSQLISDGISAIRVVQAYGLQEGIVNSYKEALVQPLKSGIRRGMITAFGGGFQRLVLMCTYSLAFYVAGIWLPQGLLTFNELIRTFLAITLAAEAVGRISSQASDTAKASGAAQAIFELIDSGDNSSIDPLSKELEHDTQLLVNYKNLTEPFPDSLMPAPPKGVDTTDGRGLSIEFRNVTFSYPSRPDIVVIRDLSLVIQPGQYVGLVGASGSGKSTILLLAARYYDPQAGQVLVGGVDVKQWPSPALRNVFGLVQQEPILFADSILYNICYGKSGFNKAMWGQGVQPKEAGDATVTSSSADEKTKKEGEAAKTDSKTEAVKVQPEVSPPAAAPVAIAVKTEHPPPPPEVVKAAEGANVAEFIASLPDSYQTFCGTRGSQLSGGQKQRIAIARMLMRPASIGAYDEASAALDSTSEKQVQAALDKTIADAKAKALSAGSSSFVPRTTLSVAHRISTLQGADRILVFDKGTLVEDGAHGELLARPNGKFRALAMAQANSENAKATTSH
jgi:ATP-binding cassette, subfamily B (MDR/TAP), member 1